MRTKSSIKLCFEIDVKNFLILFYIEGTFCSPDIKGTVVNRTYKNKCDFLGDI